jgi:hypothetical protein
MEFPIKIVVIMVICLITVLMIVVMIGGWNQQSGSWIDKLFGIFNIFGGD